jgi:hypothetical protein
LIEKSPVEARIGTRHIQEGPETIRDLGAGVPNHSELEPSGGVPHGLGGVSEAGGVRKRGAGARSSRLTSREGQRFDERQACTDRRGTWLAG